MKKAGFVKALDGVSVSVEKGKCLGILGESGSGKSTLARILCRLIEPDAGEVFIDGKNLRDYPRRDLAGKVQMVFQDPFASLNPKLTVGTALFEATADGTRDVRLSKIEETLKMVGLPAGILRSYPHQFSGGQRQRIAIARALLRKPEILIADEPLSSLDISIQNQLLEVFERLRETHSLTIVFISHDIVVTANMADNVIVMRDGRIVEQGETKAVISSPEQEYTKKLLAAVPRMV